MEKENVLVQPLRNKLKIILLGTEDLSKIIGSSIVTASIITLIVYILVSMGI
jgi:hypothetical protein